MASANFVLLIGNLTADPAVRSAGGSSVSDLRLAVSDRYKNKAGEQVENTCFVDVTVWGQQAENCVKYLRKGSPVLVEGRLQYDQWEKDGVKRSKLRVNANRVQFLGGRRDETASTGDGGEARPASSQPAAPVAEAASNDDPPPPF